MGYSFQLTAMVLLYAPSHRQDNTYHCICYTSRGALAGMRNSSIGRPWGIDLTTHCIMSRHLPQTTTHSPIICLAICIKLNNKRYNTLAEEIKLTYTLQVSHLFSQIVHSKFHVGWTLLVFLCQMLLSLGTILCVCPSYCHQRFV